MISFRIRLLALAGVVSCALIVGAAETAAAQTASNVVCNSCIGPNDIATGAVRSSDIANSTIESHDIRDGAINSQDIRNNAITGNKILNGTVTSVDIAPSLNLGIPGNDGDFTVKNAGGTVAVRLNGDGANVLNLFSDVPGQSNGLIKAWARINPDGSVHSCWRCNTDPAQTLRGGIGAYSVDFTPLATDIRARPRVVVLDSHDMLPTFGDVIKVDDSGDFSSVNVRTFDLDGLGEDSAFTVLIL